MKVRAGARARAMRKVCERVRGMVRERPRRQEGRPIIINQRLRPPPSKVMIRFRDRMRLGLGVCPRLQPSPSKVMVRFMNRLRLGLGQQGTPTSFQLGNEKTYG